MLGDGTRLLTIDGILFDAKHRVNVAVDGAEEHFTKHIDHLLPTGPPLNITGAIVDQKPIKTQPPAPPSGPAPPSTFSRDGALPPAPPTEEQLFNFRNGISPPAPPPSQDDNAEFQRRSLSGVSAVKSPKHGKVRDLIPPPLFPTFVN